MSLCKLWWRNIGTVKCNSSFGNCYWRCFLGFKYPFYVSLSQRFCLSINYQRKLFIFSNAGITHIFLRIFSNDRKTRNWSSAAEQIHDESFIWSYENTKQRISKLNLNYVFFSNSKEVRHFYHKAYLCFCITYKNKNFDEFNITEAGQSKNFRL